MKRWLMILLCIVLSSSAFAQLNVLVGPSALVDRQNEIFGAALGLNATLWGTVPGRLNLGVTGIFDMMLFLGSSSDTYDFNDKTNRFGFNICTGPGYVFTLTREIQLLTFTRGGPADSMVKAMNLGISRKYPYSEEFDIVKAVDDTGVLASWKREEDRVELPEITIQYLPITVERRLHTGLGLNLNISPIYDTADQDRSGFFIGLGGSLIFISLMKPDAYEARVIGISNDVIVYDTVGRLWYPGGNQRIIELTFFYDLFDLFGIDEPGYQFNYDNKFGILFSVSLWGRQMTRPPDGATPVRGGIIPLAVSTP